MPTLCDWPGDGRWILYSERSPQTEEDIWVLPITLKGRVPEGAQPKPYVRSPFSDAWARFSPGASPRWVAYRSTDSGREEVYVDAFPQPRGRIQISTAGGSQPQWGESGRELFYVSSDGKRMT